MELTNTEKNEHVQPPRTITLSLDPTQFRVLELRCRQLDITRSALLRQLIAEHVVPAAMAAVGMKP